MNNQPSARVLAHSINSAGSELITFEITCHRWILAEINTHRMLSRNFRSSRAVPTAKLFAEIRANPAMPVAWMKNKPGMQAAESMSDKQAKQTEMYWRNAAHEAIAQAAMMAAQGLHKQWVNRIIEPFLFVHGVISGTEWSNFYARRRHTDAQPEFKALADAMWQVHKASSPVLLSEGHWHLPYVTVEDSCNVPQTNCVDMYANCCRLSVARVARVSYKPHTGEDTNLAAEFERHDRLLANGHMSPFEHQARPAHRSDIDTVHWGEHSGNFDDSWVQYRKLIPGENITEYNPED